MMQQKYNEIKLGGEDRQRQASGPVPVLLLTGFLGAGKTSLLNRLIKQGQLKHAALIINEFGSVGIDHQLVETADENPVELMNGCLCCTIKGDLPDTVTTILARAEAQMGDRPQCLIIETTGLADPAPILQALLGTPFLAPLIRVDGVLTVIDAEQGTENLDHYAEARRQITFADNIILSKTDLCNDTDDCTALRQKIALFNPTATILIAPKISATAKEAEAKFCHALLKRTEMKPEFSDIYIPQENEKNPHHNHQKNHHQAHQHDKNRHSETICSFVLESASPLPLFIAEQFCALLSAHYGRKILRLKGLIYPDKSNKEPYLLQAVQGHFYPPQILKQAKSKNTKNSAAKISQIVLITDDVAETKLRALFDSCRNIPAIDRPDRAALTNNPLAVSGLKF